MRRIDLIQSTTFLVLVFSFIPALSHAQSDLQKQDFFEAKIRPVLIEHCYQCHNSHGTKEGDLAVDFKQGLLTGGFNGPAIELNNAAGSTLLQALRHENDLRMPKDGPKLSKQVITDFQKWIEDGAFAKGDQNGGVSNPSLIPVFLKPFPHPITLLTYSSNSDFNRKAYRSPIGLTPSHYFDVRPSH
jgi:hypothetical protein